MYTIKNIKPILRNSFHFYQFTLAVASLLFYFSIFIRIINNFYKSKNISSDSYKSIKTDFSTDDDNYVLQNFKPFDVKKEFYFLEKVICVLFLLYYYLSSFTICIMSFDRLISVWFPLKYKTKSLKASKLINLINCFIGLVVSILPVLTNNYELFFFNTENSLSIPDGFFSFYVLLFIFVLPLTSSVIANILCHYFLKKKMKLACTTGNILTTTQILRNRRFKKNSKTLKFLSFYYIFSCLPIFCLIVLRKTINWNINVREDFYIPKQGFFEIYNLLFFICLIILSFNSIVQIIIYNKNDKKINYQLTKTKNALKHKILSTKNIIFNNFPSNIFNGLLNCFRHFSRFLSRCVRIINRHNEEVVIEFISPPRGNPGRENVFEENSF